MNVLDELNQTPKTDNAFKKIMYKLFKFDRKIKVYDIILDFGSKKKPEILKDIPVFFEYFLLNPALFETFIHTIMDFLLSINKPNTNIVYKDTNCATLLTSGVFHLTKMYHIIYGLESSKEACKYYIKPFNVFLTFLFESEIITDLKQNSRYFLNIFQYLLLLTYVTHKAQINDEHNPFVTYVNGIIADTFSHIQIDLFPDIVKLLLSEYQSDIYDYDLLSLYDFDGTQYKPSHTYLKDLNNFTTYTDNLLSVVKIDSYIDDLYNFVYEQLYENSNICNVKIALYINKYFIHFLWHIDDNGFIIIDDKWQFILKSIWIGLAYSVDLKDDFMYILNVINFDSIPYNDHNYFFVNEYNENIMFPIVKNRFLTQNLKFIVDILKAYVTNKLDDIHPKLEKVLNSDDFYLINYQDDDLLTCVLKTFEYKENDVTVNELSLNSPIFQYGSLSLHNTKDSTSNTDMPLPIKIRKAFKPIIHKLLILQISYLNDIVARDATTQQNVLEYYKLIHKYKDSLLEIGLDLAKYPFRKHIVYSPTTNVENRRKSINNSTEADLKEDDVFFGFLSPKQNKTLQKLSRLYHKSVQSNDNSINNYNRILIIRNYLQHKYHKNNEDYDPYYVTVRKDHEFQDFYTFWATNLQYGSLHEAFNIRYQDNIGLDYGGLSKQLFTHIGNQMIEYFTKIEGTDRYIIKPDTPEMMLNFLGQLMALILSFGLTIPFNLSIMYLGHMMFNKNHISEEELFLYYILDISTTNIKTYVKYCSTNSIMNIEDDSCNVEKVLKDLIPNTYTYEEIVPASFLEGFFISKKIFYSTFRNINDKIRIYDLAKLLCRVKITADELKSSIFNFDRTDTLKRTILQYYDSNLHDFITFNENDESPTVKQYIQVYSYLKDLMIQDDKKEYDKMYDACTDEILMSIIIKMTDRSILEKKKLFKSKSIFRQSILMFWTGSSGVTLEQYVIKITSNLDKPISHTCFNTIELPLLENKQQLYNMMMKIFVLDQHKAFEIS